MINLEFSNGTLSRLIYEHALFDLTLNKYVYFDGYSYFAFVGHEFAILGEDGEYDRATLEKAYVTVEYTASYSLITAYHMNYFVDGFFSLPGGIDGLFNIFTYDEDLTYNEKEMQNDIETYGLYTYEDFEAYVPYEVFEYFFPAKYFKVAVGKGMITYDELLSLIEKHLSKHGLT